MKKLKKQSKGWLFMLPQAILSLIFIIGIGNGLLQSLGMIPSIGLNRLTAKYYIELFSQPDFLDSLKFSLYVALTSSLLATVLGVALCGFLVALGWEKGWFIRVLQVPIMVPHIVVALFMIHLFSQSGMIARLLYRLGFLSGQEAFPAILYTKNGIGIILSYLWKEIPFVAYFVLPLMTNISKSLGEAAVNLGATRFQTFFKVTLPLCMPAVKNAFLLIFAFAFGAYELPFLLGATTPKALPVQAYIQYTHPDLKNRPYAMAANGLIAIVTLGLSWAYYLLLQKGRGEDGSYE